MFWIFASLIAVVVLFVALGYSKKGWKMNPKQWLALFGLLIILGGTVATVPTGHTGILTTFGKVEDKTLEAGMHMKSPFQEIVCMDNRTQVAHLELSAFSSDIQEVLVSYSMNYQIEKANAQKIYKEIGVDYYNTVMAPRIQEVVKSVIAKYTAEDLIESREALSVQITDELIEQLGAYNIVVVSTAVEDIDFSDSFTASVEDKVVAEQALLKAQTEQAQKTMEQEKAAEREKIQAAADAEVKKTQAAADAEVAKIKAAAEAEAQKLAADAAKYAGEKEAEANKALAESITEALIKYYEALGWDGKLPDTVVSGTEGILPILGGGN
ncbi:MAG: prohibitin family protein [Clostridia bacterium]|nr:prohibitin family protein [Clostridia bacterium]